MYLFQCSCVPRIPFSVTRGKTPTTTAPNQAGGRPVSDLTLLSPQEIRPALLAMCPFWPLDRREVVPDFVLRLGGTDEPAGAGPGEVIGFHGTTLESVHRRVELRDGGNRAAPSSS